MSGLQMPSDFPSELFEAINARVSARSAPNQLWSEFAGGWNGLRFRFLACTEHADGFTASITRYDRYKQERELFGFFVTGLAALECLCYGLFAIGAIIDPSAFAMASPGDLKGIDPKRTENTYRNTTSFQTHPIAAELSNLIKDSVYREWRVVRNVLSHRAAPGRTVSLSTVSNPPDIWNLNNILINDQLAPVRRQWLANSIFNLLSATDVFTAREL